MGRKKPAEEWFKFYYLRWMASEQIQDMPMVARGVYWELLIRQYASDEGDLPEDPATLRRRIGAELHEWKVFLPYLDALFPAYEGRRCNPRMAAVREERDCNRDQKKDASARALAAKEAKRNAPSGVPNGVPREAPNGAPSGVPNGVPEKRREEKNKLGSNYTTARAPSSPRPDNLEKERLSPSSDPDRAKFVDEHGIDSRTGTSLSPEEMEALHS